MPVQTNMTPLIVSTGSPPLTHESRPSTPSLQEFNETSSSTSAKALRQELDNLVSSSPSTATKKFAKEMNDFYRLFLRFSEEKSRGAKLNWARVRSPPDEKVIPYSQLPQSSQTDGELLNKLAVLKLNGGLGTTMGCVGPKSAIEVRDGMSFLDLTVRQIEHLNKASGANVPLLLMNSFNTAEETHRMIQKFANHNIEIKNFDQSRFPRIKKDTNMPLPESYDSDIKSWYPPGHGDLFESLNNSGILDQLIDEGKEYLFVSNIDNLGAIVDTTILKHVVDSGAEFCMEVTNKTKADVKGGTLVDYNGQIRLLEIAQVPNEHVEDFKSIRKFKIFNTNNLWVSVKAIKRLVEAQELSMEIIVNNKELNGEAIIQLETAVGAAIKHFQGAHGINVPRSRFLPVKSTSDLFLVTSDLYAQNQGVLSMNPKRMFKTVPVIKLGDHFKKVNDFLTRFRSPPHILELDHLTVTGDVTFGKAVVLKGTVIIVANYGSRIDIPSGAILDDKVVSGNLRILDH
ncbi:UTP-glucose-1-phosphate uridylyltransferase, variant 2 [Entomophthora muscae]|uniref:UTP-glucose-1-phosphate uridylyltransferase, variant 2 n=3 Tax=Entomophthora muscae TaxID=34485 RepID=A0ACC2SDL7_9FUNG|nr:UTP-glucose-1-phosphate uridylyltransferase, variant 2 [Entomophthora muscae]